MYLFMIICYVLMFVNLLNLILSGLSGYFKLEIIGANHIEFSLFSMIIFIITETLIMYFFITTGKSIKEEIQNRNSHKKLWEKERKLKMKLFPQLMLTLFLFCVIFIYGGVADNKLPTAYVHGYLFPLAMIHHLWTLKIKNNSFRDQIELIRQLDKK